MRAESGAFNPRPPVLNKALIPEGVMAESAMGVTPAPYIGVLSSSFNPNRLDLLLAECAEPLLPKEVISFREAFLAVNREERSLGGESGGLRTGAKAAC